MMQRGPDHLIYITDSEPGLSRRRAGPGFVYLDTHHQQIKDAQILGRIKQLAVPPAYRDVWIAPADNGYLQATGYDDKGRKQYRYHADWSAYRARQKFAHLAAFGEKLPRIRRRVRRVLREKDAAQKDFAIAALVRLLDRAPLRIGNDNSDDGAFGAATLRSRHIRFSRNMIKLDYRAKGGKRVRRQLKDSRLQSILQQIDDLPGKDLFSYQGADGHFHSLRSEHVNDWLKNVTQDNDISAKVFRTWAGSLAAFEIAISTEDLTIKAMAEAAAQRLHNTANIARHSYIHPKVIALANYDWNERQQIVGEIASTRRDLSKAENAMLSVIT